MGGRRNVPPYQSKQNRWFVRGVWGDGVTSPHIKASKKGVFPPRHIPPKKKENKTKTQFLAVFVQKTAYGPSLTGRGGVLGGEGVAAPSGADTPLPP